MRPYYEDDLVTLYHARWEDVPPDLLRADVLVTDPPYGIGWNTEGKSRQRGAVVDYPRVMGDDEPVDPARLLALGLPTVLFGANHYADRLPASPSWLVWDKRPTMASTDQADCELAWTNLGGPVRRLAHTWNGGASRIADHPVRRLVAGSPVSFHPTQKPVALMRWVIERCPTGTVLDTYAGSGSTLVAAKSLNRPSIGIEIDERYCETAARRCSQEVLGLSA